MFTDSDGDNPIALIIIMAYLIWATQDVYDIISGNVHFDTNSTENGGKIVNSYKVQNPSVVIGYSIYLRYFCEHRENFDGSAAGIASEWMAHNVGHDLTVVMSVLGIGADWNKRAKHADVGRTIFNEEEWYVKYPSVVIETVINPAAVIYDYYQYIH